ncbi:MAG TPA: hypothetical protein VFV87_04080 [Pirellulaceae bacterium]|nr:hypothetical protein [Pirellulaceae bacterium]
MRQKDYLLAGKDPPPKDAPAPDEGIQVGELCDRFFQAKEIQRNVGELSPLSWSDYKRTCDAIVKQFGKSKPVAKLGAADFERLRAAFGKTRGLVAVGNEIQRTHVVFKYGYDSGLIEQPVRYGQLFKRAGKKRMRILRAKQEAEHGKKLFAPEEIKRLRSTLIYVDSIEHAGNLLRYLPDKVSLLSGEMHLDHLQRVARQQIERSRSRHQEMQASVVAVATADGLRKADLDSVEVIIRADAGSGLPDLDPWALTKPQGSDQQLLIIDIDERSGPILRRRSSMRKVAYLDADWFPVGMPSAHGRVERFIVNRPR